MRKFEFGRMAQIYKVAARPCVAVLETEWSDACQVKRCHMGCSQNYGLLLVMDHITAPNI